jgi:hypothetical protein
MSDPFGVAWKVGDIAKWTPSERKSVVKIVGVPYIEGGVLYEVVDMDAFGSVSGNPIWLADERDLEKVDSGAMPS